VQTQEWLMLLLLINKRETNAVLDMTIRTHTKILSNESVYIYTHTHTHRLTLYYYYYY